MAPPSFELVEQLSAVLDRLRRPTSPLSASSGCA